MSRTPTLPGGLGGLAGGMGILPSVRATMTRIRSTIRRPTMLTQAQRVTVAVNAAATELRFITGFTMGTTVAELYGFYSGEDIVAVMSVSYDTTLAKYIYDIARNTWDPLTITLNGTPPLATATFPAVTAENTPSIGYVRMSAAPPA